MACSAAVFALPLFAGNLAPIAVAQIPTPALTPTLQSGGSNGPGNTPSIGTLPPFAVPATGFADAGSLPGGQTPQRSNQPGAQPGNAGPSNTFPNGNVVMPGFGFPLAVSPVSLPSQPSSPSAPYTLPNLTSRENISPALQLVILLTVLSIAPSIVLMMTCFTRIVIVLSLLRQALGTQQLPPNQVLVGLAMFMTLAIMSPTIAVVNNTAIQPYLNGTIDQKVALDRAITPIRGFMSRQIEASKNEADVDLFMSFSGQPPAKNWSDVPTMSLIPAFMLSELKTAFLIGFKVYLPFLVIDMVISSVLISMGMMMLPPVMISLPFKLLLFVLVDGWHLTAQSLMASFA